MIFHELNVSSRKSIRPVYAHTFGSNLTLCLHTLCVEMVKNISPFLDNIIGEDNTIRRVISKCLEIVRIFLVFFPSTKKKFGIRHVDFGLPNTSSEILSMY